MPHRWSDRPADRSGCSYARRNVRGHCCGSSDPAHPRSRARKERPGVRKINIQVAVTIEIDQLEAGDGLVWPGCHAKVAGDENASPVVDIDCSGLTPAVPGHEVEVPIPIGVGQATSAGRIRRLRKPVGSLIAEESRTAVDEDLLRRPAVPVQPARRLATSTVKLFDIYRPVHVVLTLPAFERRRVSSAAPGTRPHRHDMPRMPALEFGG